MASPKAKVILEAERRGYRDMDNVIPFPTTQRKIKRELDEGLDKHQVTDPEIRRDVHEAAESFLKECEQRWGRCSAPGDFSDLLSFTIGRVVKLMIGQAVLSQDAQT